MWEIQKMLGSCGAWSGGTANPQKLPVFPPVAITKFCRSRSMCERVYVVSSQNVGTLEPVPLKWRRGWAVPVEIHLCHIGPSAVVLGRTVRA